MTEADLTQTEGGWREPQGEGWYVLNAQDAKWLSNEMGWYCNFEGAVRFPEFGLNLNRLPPGAPMAIYHHEPHQEGFLVLDGEALLIIDGEEHASEAVGLRALPAWRAARGHRRRRWCARPRGRRPRSWHARHVPGRRGGAEAWCRRRGGDERCARDVCEVRRARSVGVSGRLLPE